MEYCKKIIGSQPMFASDTVKLIPLGGLGEIGMNMMVLSCQGTDLVIDAGIMFPEDYMLGVDYVIPNIGYIQERKNRIKGVILTHAHEDHVGALPYILRELKAPVYGTPFTLGIIKSKLEEHGLSQSTVLHAVKPGETISINPFRIEFIRVHHSVIDGVGLGIETPAGTIVHTGDFKLSSPSISKMATDIDAFKRLGEKGVLALLSDSTNVEKIGRTPSDDHVKEELARIIQRSRGRVIVALFASNVCRIQQVVDIAGATGRKIILNGRSIELSARIARELGLLEIPPGMEHDMEAIETIPDNRIILLTTGSQGEPMSAMSRMATGTHKHIKIRKGDTVILSSKFIPGNERAIAKIINNLFRRGAEVIYERISDIHVSGHAFRDELREMIQITKPRYFIPIHGEYRHLVHHARLAEDSGIDPDRIFLLENGEILCFSREGAFLEGKVDTYRVLVDGKGIGDVGRLVLKERRLLSEDGMVIVTMAIDEDTGFIVFGPEIASKGFVFESETGHILQDAQCVVLEVIEETVGVPDRVDMLRKRIRTSLREYFNFTIKRKPMILPFILEI